MDKKKNLTAEERALFAEAVKNVKRLGKSPAVPADSSAGAAEKPPSQSIRKTSPTNNLKSKKNIILKRSSALQGELPMSTAYSPINLDFLDPEDWVGVEDRILFHRSGLQDHLLKKLAQGKLQVESRLDLHQLTAAAALAEADLFLKRCQQQGRRLVLIIHGKGRKSARPILKNALNLWLRAQPAVLAFHSAQPKDGGAGAVYILIKKH